MSKDQWPSKTQKRFSEPVAASRDLEARKAPRSKSVKNRTNSAEMIFQDVRKSNEEMTSSDVKKVTKMEQKINQNGQKCVHKLYFRTPN